MTQIVDIALTKSSFGLSDLANDDEAKVKILDLVDDANGDNDDSDDDDDDSSDDDAQDESDEDEEDEDDEDDIDSEDEDDDESSTQSKLKAQTKADREYIKKLQSETDSMKYQLQQLYTEFYNLKKGKEQEILEPDLGDDDDLVDAGAMKRYVDAQLNARKLAEARAKEQANNQWLNSQPDLKEVNAYIDANNLAKDPAFVNANTDSIGLYYMVKNHMASNKKQVDKKKRRRKGPVPPTGGNRPMKKSLSKLSKTEQQFKALGERIGIDLSAVHG